MGVRLAFLWLIIFIAVGFPSYAVEKPGPSSQQASTSAAEREVDVLRAQLEIMRSYDERLLSTVYWSLGGLITIAALLIGFGWFANFRVYERDKNALAKELRSILENEIRTTFQNLEENIGKRFEVLKKEMEKAATSATKSFESEVKQQFGEVRYDLFSLKYKVTESEAEQWLTRGVHTNALRRYCGTLEIALERNSQFLVSRSLDNMHAILKAIIEKRSSLPDAELIREVSAVLGRVPEEHGIAVSAIHGLLESIRKL